MKSVLNLLFRVIRDVVVLVVLFLAAVGYFIVQPVRAKGTPAAESIDPQRLKTHVSRLASDFSPRSYLDTTNPTRSANYIRQEFQRAGASVTSQFYVAQGLKFENVIARFPAANERRIIVGAHYDAFDVTPGADDNASGVAGLIELAHLLSKAKLDHTVELVAFCTEEPPFFTTEGMGSAQHAKMLKENGVQVLGMIALEMIGYFSDEEGSQSYPSPVLSLFYPSRGNFIGVIGNIDSRKLVRFVKRSMVGSTDLPVRSISIPPFVPGVDFSDHRSYWEYDMPAVMISDTAFYRNRTYHEAEDTPDRLDYVRIGKVVVGVYHAVLDLDRDVK
jgi:Zn-dependent M28 family amino/carboxypeptidase